MRMTASVVNPSIEAEQEDALRRAAICMAGLGRRLAAIAGEAQLFEVAFLHDGRAMQITLVEPMAPALYTQLQAEISGPLQIEAYLAGLPAEVVDADRPPTADFPTGTALLEFLCAHGVAKMGAFSVEAATATAPVSGTLRFAMNDQRALMMVQLHKRPPVDGHDSDPQAHEHPTFH